MAARKLIAATMLAGLALAACDDNGRTRTSANGVCKPFAAPASAAQGTAGSAAATALPPTSVGAPTAPPADPSASLDDCLHRWGYTLAASSDPANFVAEATLAACANALSAWNQQALTADNAGGAVQAPSLMTGQPTNPLAEHHAFAQERALFYVVQARAGHCGPPPAPPAPRG